MEQHYYSLGVMKGHHSLSLAMLHVSSLSPTDYWAAAWPGNVHGGMEEEGQYYGTELCEIKTFDWLNT